MSSQPPLTKASKPEASQPESRRDGEAACIIAALAQLNATTSDLSKHIVMGISLHKESLDQFDSLAVEVQKTVAFTQAILDTLVSVREVGGPRAATEDRVKGGSGSRSTDVTNADVEQPIDVDDLDDVEDLYYSTAEGRTSKGNVMGPPKTRGSWTEDTIMVGATINADRARSTLTPADKSMSFRGKGVAAASQSHMNYSLTGQGGLGDLMGTPLVLSRSIQSGGGQGKIMLRSVEDMKRSRKMRRGPREPRPAFGSAASTTGVVFPSYIHSYFNINKGMKLSLEQAQAVAYIFGKSMNQHETLFKRGDSKLVREDFACFLPGNEPSDYIMQLMAHHTSWTQSQLS
ncbi:hypothetical protein PIB30_080070 [Stylosanthes scabra]|uniref:Uncharacterized protein n=1 Tax=Stylosanthes scabra TaxID=79078 RepID=A0ABU6XQ70_9FABA|nr:hypothetical protein [Stylosanthes scabra]